MQRRIGLTVQISGNSGLPFAMVRCLNQCNVYIKRKLRECRAQKCNPCFGAKSPHHSTGLHTTQFHAVPYGPTVQYFREFWATFRYGTVFTSMQCLYQKEAIRECRAQKCNACFSAKSPLRSTCLQTTRFHTAGYRADSTNLPCFRDTFRDGTVFEPMPCLYQKEAKRMQSAKI